MSEPNPIWGIHAAPGSISGVLLERTDSGTFQVLDEVFYEASFEREELLEQVTQLLESRQMRGRATIVALPDAEGCCVTAQVPEEELADDEDEIYRDLYEFTPFEPEDGVIFYRAVPDSEHACFDVAALPLEVVNQTMAAMATVDPGFHGLGLTGPSVVGGTRALGLVGERGFVLDVEPRRTLMYALDGKFTVRYMLPVGYADIEERPDYAVGLGQDVLRCIDYHRELHLRNWQAEDAAPEHDIVLSGPAADEQLWQALSGPLGDRLATVTWRADATETVTGADGEELDPVAGARYVAAIGAALESFRSRDDRLVMRHPPSTVPEYIEEKPRWPLAAAAVAGVVIVAGLLFHFLGGDTGTTGNGDGVTTPEQRPDPAQLAAHLEHAALRSSYARAVENVASVLARAPTGIRVERLRLSAAGGAYDVEFVTGSPDAIGDRAAIAAALATVSGIEGAESTVTDGRVTTRFRVLPGEGPPKPDSKGARLRTIESAEGPQLGPAFTLERLRELGTPDASGADGPERVRIRVPPLRSFATLRAIGIPDMGPAPVSVTLVAVADGVDVEADLRGPRHFPGLWLTDSERGYVGRSLERAKSLESFEAAGVANLFEAPSAAAPASLTATADGAARVRIVHGAGPAGRQLERRRDGDSPWQPVARLGEAPGELVDDVPGRSGSYVWRVRAGGEVRVTSRPVAVSAPVEAELVTGLPGGRARFRLTRPYRGSTVETSVEVGKGDLLSASSPLPEADGGGWLEFVTPWTITAVRNRDVVAVETVRVPRFLPDGKVERGADGAAMLEERRVERSSPQLEVEAEASDQEPRQWVRKMTDG